MSQEISQPELAGTACPIPAGQLRIDAQPANARRPAVQHRHANDLGRLRQRRQLPAREGWRRRETGVRSGPQLRQHNRRGIVAWGNERGRLNGWVREELCGLCRDQDLEVAVSDACSVSPDRAQSPVDQMAKLWSIFKQEHVVPRVWVTTL